MSDIEIDRQDRVLTLRLTRPAKRNALTVAMYRALTAALEAAPGEDIGAIVFGGDTECFTAGNDLQEFLTDPPAGPDAPVLCFLRALARCPLPLLAAVNGAAVGIGTTLLLHCDYVYAGENARFQLPFVPLGLAPEGGASVLLPALVGPRRAAALLYEGEPFTAAQAQAWGLVDAVVAPADALGQAQRKAQALAALPGGAIRATRMLLQAPRQAEILAAIDREAALFGERLRSAEARAAMQAALRRR
ncbi:MAG: enoyl-CoA hydratase-related protein [Pseudomonadota bacterium]|nr:enoyl-CoA hydratase-related protein [Pseudomonadota bacterium]